MSEKINLDVKGFDLDNDPPWFSYPAFKYIDSSKETTGAMAKKFKEVYTDTEQNYVFLARGTSGVFISTLIAIELPEYNIKILVARKPHEKHHSGPHDAYVDEADICIIVDDFISSGYTVHAIVEYFEKENEGRPVNIDTIMVGGEVEADRIKFPFKNAISHYFHPRLDS